MFSGDVTACTSKYGSRRMLNKTHPWPSREPTPSTIACCIEKMPPVAVAMQEFIGLPIGLPFQDAACVPDFAINGSPINLPRGSMTFSPTCLRMPLRPFPFMSIRFPMRNHPLDA